MAGDKGVLLVRLLGVHLYLGLLSEVRVLMLLQGRGWRWRDLMRRKLSWRRTILFQKGDMVEVIGLDGLGHPLLHHGYLVLQGRVALPLEIKL